MLESSKILESSIAAFLYVLKDTSLPDVVTIVSILSVSSGSLVIIWLTGKRGGLKGWYAGETDFRDEPTFPKETDDINRFMANVRRHPNKYVLTPILCQQFVSNHAKGTEVPHNQFPAESSWPGSHMTPDHIAQFAAIWSGLPWTIGAHVDYKVEGGMVRYRDTNEPARSNAFIVRIIEGYERSNGAWPKLNKLEDDIRNLEEMDRRNNFRP
jgi:hypothetical protein